jgi:cysteine desulfurase
MGSAEAAAGERGAPARVYLDWAATAPLRPEARTALLAAYEVAWANASSVHASGRAARAGLERARAQVAALVGARPERVVFTSGATEANNLAIRGSVALRPERRHIVVSAVEHHSVLEPCRALARAGLRVTEVPPDGEGRVDPERMAAALGPDTALCALMLANNEVGAVQPVAAVAAACRRAGVPLLVDAVAAAGRIPIDVGALGADLLSLTAHKLGGPKGAGALYVAEGCELAPLCHGGAQERRWRPGTEDVPACVGFGVAAELAARELPEEAGRLRALDRRLRAAILAADLGAVPTGPRQEAARLPGLVSFAFPGLDGEALMVQLDLLGIEASTGAACTSGSVEPSHVLSAMGLPPAACRAPLRLSLGRGSGQADVEAAVAALREAVATQRRALAAGGGG